MCSELMKIFPGRTEVALTLKYGRSVREVEEVFTPEIVLFSLFRRSDIRMLP